MTPQELADENHRVIAEDLAALGISYDLYTRTTTRNHTAVVQELFTGVYANGYFIEKTTFGAISPSTGRTLPDRYIEGTCPICGYPSARGDQCDNCGNQLDPADLLEPALADQRRGAGVRRDPALLPRPAGAGRRAEGVARRARGERHLAAQRDPVQPEHPRGDPAAGDDPRHRLGHPGAARRVARQPDQAALRVVRRGDRLPLREHRVGPPHRATRRRWREWWNDPRGAVLLLHGQGQHHLPQPDLARRAAGLQRQGRQGRQAGGVRRAQPAHRGGLLGVPDHGGQEVLVLAARRDLRARPAQPLPAGRLPLLRGRRRAREPGLRLHLGRVRTPHQRRARRRLGQPGQPHGHHGRQELRRDPGRRRADRHGPGAARPRRGDLRGRRRPDRPAPAEGGHRRGDARRRRGEPLRLRLGALEAEGRRRAGAARHDPARGGPVRGRPEHDPVAVPAVLGQRGRPRARRLRRRAADAAAARGRRPRRRSGLPDPHRRLLDARPAGSGARSWWARRSPSRRRCSPSSTPPSSTRSSQRLASGE